MNTGFLGSAVATVLTVYGIETVKDLYSVMAMSMKLQQYLPFTVLKPNTELSLSKNSFVATVLTVYGIETYEKGRNVYFDEVATVLTVYGIETKSRDFSAIGKLIMSCNSTYRLRY